MTNENVLNLAINIIKQYEGLKLTPYYATKYEQSIGKLTIGYGFTTLGGSPVKKEDKITIEQATALLNRKIKAYEASINELIPGINENQLSACISLAFNIGLSAFTTSTLVKKIKNKDTTESVASEFLRWNKQNGKVLKGLVRRRQAEYELFLKPIN